jgi:hypothetical protein
VKVGAEGPLSQEHPAARVFKYGPPHIFLFLSISDRCAGKFPKKIIWKWFQQFMCLRGPLWNTFDLGIFVKFFLAVS